MNTKTHVCRDCQKALPVNSFTKDNKAESGLSSRCRACQKKCRIEKAKLIVVPKEKKCSRCKQVKPANKFHANKATKTGLQFHCIECDRKSYARDKGKILARSGRYKRRRYHGDPGYRLRSQLSSQLSLLLKTGFAGTVKRFSKVTRFTGLSTEEILAHFEAHLRTGMSPGNYGTVWEVDHTRPVSSFDHTNEPEVYECWNPANLRPIFCDENRRKGDQTPVGRARQPQSPHM